MAHFELTIFVKWKGSEELSDRLIEDFQEHKYKDVEWDGEQAFFFEEAWDTMSSNPLAPLEPIVSDYKDLDFYVLSHIREIRPQDADGSSIALIRKGYIVFYKEKMVVLDEQDEDFKNDQWVQDTYPDGWENYAATEADEDYEDEEPTENVANSHSFFQNFNSH
jgi:hypothetical protein